MAEAKDSSTSEAPEQQARIYEVGYHIAPTVKEEDLEKVVASIRTIVEKHGGTFITEGAPSLTRLSYEISGTEGGKRVEYDRAYFGWLKFEAPVAAATALETALKGDMQILRHIVFKTVREETRARLKAPTLREVRRTDTIKTTPKREEENAAPVSEAELEKALQDITAE
jgi:ribosomal protein S6